MRIFFIIDIACIARVTRVHVELLILRYHIGKNQKNGPHVIHVMDLGKYRPCHKKFPKNNKVPYLSIKVPYNKSSTKVFTN